MEKQVWWDAAQRHEAFETAGRREHKAEKAGGRFEPGQGHAAGCAIKKMVGSADRREAVAYLRAAYSASERRSCRVLNLHRGLYRRKPARDEQAYLRMRIKEIAQVRVRYGYRRIHVLLRREGWQVNHKWVYRLYKEEGLNLRTKGKHKKISAPRAPMKEMPTRLNQCWAMDFVSDQLYNGRRFRALTVMDMYSRKCLAIDADKRITGEKVTDVLSHVQQERGLPERIKVDNGPEFISKALDAWAYFHKVQLDYSRPGTPTDNAYIESFNGSFRDECLNTNWFMSLEDARSKIDQWRNDYNCFRPHSGLTYQTPAEFARQDAVLAI